MARFCVKGMLAASDTQLLIGKPFQDYVIPNGPTRVASVNPTWTVMVGVVIGVASAGPPVINALQIVTYYVAAGDITAAKAFALGLATTDFPTGAPTVGAAWAGVASVPEIGWVPYDMYIEGTDPQNAMDNAVDRAGSVSVGGGGGWPGTYRPISAFEIQ